MTKVKQSLPDKERLRIQTKAADKTSFIGRNVALNYLLLYLLYPVAAIYSAFTGGSALLVYIQSISNNYVFAFTFTVLVAFVLEISKYFFGKAVSDDVRQHVWTESDNHVTAFVLKAIAFVGIFGFSITLSLSGAPDVAKDYRQSTTPLEVQLVNKDSINQYYDHQIEAEREDITRGERMTWKGAIIADGRNIIKGAKTNIQVYETKRDSTLKEAKIENEKITTGYEKDTKKAGDWLTGFAGLGEALAIIILLFVGNYESGAEKEVLTATPNGQNTANTAAVNSPSKTAVTNTQLAVVPQRKPIGFEIPNSRRYNGSRYNDGQPTADPNGPTAPNSHGESTAKTNGQNSAENTATSDGDTAKYPIGQCAHCGGDYEKTVWNKKYCSDECKYQYHAAKNQGNRFDAKRYHKKE